MPVQANPKCLDGTARPRGAHWHHQSVRSRDFTGQVDANEQSIYPVDKLTPTSGVGSLLLLASRGTGAAHGTGNPLKLGRATLNRAGAAQMVSSLSPLQRDLLVLYLPFATLTALTFANTPDDALITMRHAYHLLTLGQPVFNPGEDAEGFTSPLHVIVAALVELLPGGGTLLKLKIVSVLAALAALWQARRLLNGVALAEWARLIGLFLIGSSWALATSASNGLETSLVVLLVTGLTASLIHRDTLVRSAIWAALLAIVRPEAVLVIALLAIATVFVVRERPRWLATAWLLGPVLSICALVLVRWHFFGAVVPNTYFAKKRSLDQTFLGGIEYFFSSQPLAHIFFPIAALLLVVQVALVVVSVRALPANRALAYPLAVVSAQTVAILQSGGDWMTGARFLVPALPSFVALICTGMVVAKPRLAKVPHVGVLLALFVVGMAAPVGINAAGRQHPGDVHNVIDTEFAPVWTLRGVSETALISSGNYGAIGDMWPQAVDAIRCLPPGATVAHSEAGLLGYERLDLDVIDTRGLTDTWIAKKAPAAEKTKYGVIERNWFDPSSTLGQYLSQRRPEMILNMDADPQDTAIGGLYVLHKVINFRVGRPLSIYVRKDFHCAD